MTYIPCNLLTAGVWIAPVLTGPLQHNCMDALQTHNVSLHTAALLMCCRAVVASVVADALQKAQAQAQQEQATRDAAKAEYEEELARVRVYVLESWAASGYRGSRHDA